MAKNIVKKQTAKAAKLAASAPEKPISNRQAIRNAVDAGGPEMGMKVGKKLGMKESTVASYVKDWLKIRDKVKGSGKADPKTEKPQRERGEFEPHFKHATRQIAHTHMIAIARRSGTANAAFHILEENGMFAVVPAHFKPSGPPPQFKKDDVVMDTIIKDSRALVLEAGPEQCVVADGDGKERVVPNYYLVKVDGPKPKPTPKAPKPEERSTNGKSAAKRAVEKGLSEALAKSTAAKKKAPTKPAAKKAKRK